MAVTAADVKALREKTGAGPAECKNALTETNGDFEAAVKLLKEKGLAAAEKRADRATNQGRIAVKTAEDAAALVELVTETDFVARNPEFIALADEIAQTVLDKRIKEPTGELNDMVKALATKIRENMSLKRIKLLEAGEGVILGSYIHGEGAIGVAAALGSDKPEALKTKEAQDLVFSLAMHAAAFNPQALSKADIKPEIIKEQEEIFRKQMEKDEKLKDKPANVLDGILKGKMNKYLADLSFVDQAYLKNEKITVAKALEEAGKAAGAKFEIKDYVYFKAGC
ncbi:MAG: translation elongation factor Ts [Spirochaetaceae bacterium]|jgi:elongation factor Ts|nr:translation elongation factor Ts [Spirochaetaceae bacterium]